MQHTPTEDYTNRSKTIAHYLMLQAHDTK